MVIRLAPTCEFRATYTGARSPQRVPPATPDLPYCGSGDRPERRPRHSPQRGVNRLGEHRRRLRRATGARQPPAARDRDCPAEGTAPGRVPYHVSSESQPRRRRDGKPYLGWRPDGRGVGVLGERGLGGGGSGRPAVLAVRAFWRPGGSWRAGRVLACEGGSWRRRLMADGRSCGEVVLASRAVLRPGGFAGRRFVAVQVRLRSTVTVGALVARRGAGAVRLAWCRRSRSSILRVTRGGAFSRPSPKRRAAL